MPFTFVPLHMVNVLEKLLDFCSSLKLAICLILSLAFYLASATFYEARYGTRAVQEIIYGSKPFILLMALLSINVMAAVLVRYPWKRKQTGFIITHFGIETLLLGCLLSFRFSVDGKVSMEPGQKSEVINLNDEEVGVTMADAGGRERRHVFPVQLWSDAGYPGLAHFVAGSAGLVDLPQETRWPEGHTVDWNLGGGAKLEVLDWLPAAVGETNLKPTPDGFPAAIVHLGGSLPNGMPMDQTLPLVADAQGNGMVRPFGGTLEMDLWKARSDDEVREFLNPPPVGQLADMGRVDVYLNGKRYLIDVKQDSLGKSVQLGDSGYTAVVEDYVSHTPPPQLPENHGAAAIASEPVDPQIRFSLIGPQGPRRYLLAAWHPQFMAHLDDADQGHGMATTDDPLIWYWHPQTYVTTKEGTRGRLWLLQAPDGNLYARMFQLPTADQTTKPPFEVQVGQEMKNFWLNISFAVTQHIASGTLANEFRPAHVTAQQMDDHTRAIKVALEVDGSRQEVWVEREGVPVELNTPRGPVQLDYNFREYELGFSVGLDHAEQTNDPGSDQAAAYTSGITVLGSDTMDGPHTITMNEPITAQGLTFYQAGFANVEGTAISTLSVRHDPGWIIKYLGCAGIIGGIFTMFYMKAYFQRPAAAPAAQQKKKQSMTAAMAKSA
jgi:ResB-like family